MTHKAQFLKDDVIKFVPTILQCVFTTGIVLVLKGVLDLHLDISTYLRRKLYKSGYIIRCIVDFNCHKIHCMVGSQVIGKKWPVSVEEGR